MTEFEFGILKKTENGNVFQHVEYGDTKRMVPISYKNVEDYLQVLLFRLINGAAPIYDDKGNSFHLSALNKKYNFPLIKRKYLKIIYFFPIITLIMPYRLDC